MFMNACKYFPHIYQFVWNKLRNRNINKESSVVNGVIKQCKDYILKEIQEYMPNNIVCTHVNAGAVINYLKKEGLLNGIKTYTIGFDYCLCPYWESNSELDYIVLPADFMRDEIKAKGFKDEQILTFGIPVAPRFTIKVDKFEAREKLGLDREKFSVVLYSGGNCLSSAYKIVKDLMKCKKDIEIIAICGRNEKEYDKIDKYIKKHGIKNIKLEGFCDKLDLYYSACDLVITRGGGMGLTEQLNKNIPFVLRENLIINEKINKELFIKLGLAEGINKVNQAHKIVDRLAGDENKLLEMKKLAGEIVKPSATKDFVDFLLN